MTLKPRFMFFLVLLQASLLSLFMTRAPWRSSKTNKRRLFKILAPTYIELRALLRQNISLPMLSDPIDSLPTPKEG